jgi:hypothetical protein
MRKKAVLERVSNTLIAAGCTLPKLGSAEEREATRRWNGALQPRPALVARCATTAQVSTAIVPMRNPIAHYPTPTFFYSAALPLTPTRWCRTASM